MTKKEQERRKERSMFKEEQDQKRTGVEKRRAGKMEQDEWR